jgi:molybdopterin converting factor small subunit
MQVQVRFFSHLSQMIGTQQVVLELPESARMADLTLRLGALYPQHAALIERLAYLLDERSAAPHTELYDGAQVLALMVLSGG